MLHILFMILKIIGIIIAIILGLVVALALVVLFVPLRYRIDGTCGGTFETLEGSVRFSWLLHLFAGYFIRENGETRWQVRAAWKKLNVPKKESEPEPVKKIVSEKTSAVETPNIQKTIEEKPKNKQGSKSKSETKKIEAREPEKKSWFEKIKYTITSICDKIKLLISAKDKAVEFINEEIHRNAFGKIVAEIKRLFRFLRPRKIEGRVRYGFDDPYITGKILAGAAMFYPFYADMLSIQPDFENEVLEGELHIKGRVRGVYAVIIMFNLILNKDIRTTYKNVRKFQL